MRENKQRRKINVKIPSNLGITLLLMICIQTVSAQDVECDYSITTSNLADRTTLGFNLNAGVSLTQISGTITPATLDDPEIALHFNGTENPMPCTSTPCDFGGINKTISFTQTVRAYSFQANIIHAPVVGAGGEAWELRISKLTPGTSRSVEIDVILTGGSASGVVCPEPHTNLVNPTNEATPLDFGKVKINSANPTQSIQVQNTGDADVVLLTNPSPPGGQFQYTGDHPAFPMHIQPAAHQSIGIEMLTSNVGRHVDKVSFTSNDAVKPRLDITLQGEVTVSDKVITNSIGMKFMPIPEGKFVMGSPPNEHGREDDEKQHEVTISKPFYLQTTEVSQGQWKKIMGNNPSYFINCGDDCPVEEVSWNDAQQFIKKLNQMESTNKYRLPTEAEWEYGCRAGTETAYSFGDGLDKLGEYAWYWENSENQTHPVGKKKPNAWDLYDTHGNVKEWVQDWYGDYPSNSVVDPKGNDKDRFRVLRGGSWFIGALFLRSADRYGYGPDGRSYFNGFRVARDF